MKMELIPGDFALRRGTYQEDEVGDGLPLAMVYLPTNEDVESFSWNALLLHDLIYAAETFLSRKRKLPDTYIGTTISEGTHIPDDIFDKMDNFMLCVPPQTLSPSQLQLWASLVEEWQTCDILDKLELLNEDMFNFFNEIAPEGTYFGAHIGDLEDGALLGFWSILE